MTTENNGDQENMETTTTPSSLSSVASSSKRKVVNTKAMGTGLEARGVHAWFGNHHALADVSLDFAAGTVTALIGPSGCGKSTFIRTLNRMHEFIPSAAMAGQVILDGKDIYDPSVDVTKIRLQIGMVFQKPNPFPSMTIGENVLSGLKLAQLKTESKDDLLEECLVKAGLWNEVKDRLHDQASALSGGQQQRLCIARTIAIEPEIILMDEPCSALDPIATAKIEELIDELKENFTIIIVTHSMQQAARVSDMAVFFNMGKIIEAGTTDTIFTNPVNQQTQDYITGRFG
jgi:phosphate transport system ATP-binding protein